MKFIHISDLHIGKRLCEYSLLEDQEAVLERILEIADTEMPDGVIIAGDVYDKSVPSTEAVSLFDLFLSSLAKRRLEVFVISGNHDSPERMAFGSKIMDASGIHISPVYDGEIKKTVLTDSFGKVNVFMLPFVKPSNVRRFFPDDEIVTYTDAVRTALSGAELDGSERNILVTHQFVTGSLRCESEEISVGGTDNVDASVFDGFDYVALGHIHTAQSCSRSTIRYCGTPLKYSFSEMNDEKTVTVVELGAKDDKIDIRTVPLTPIREMSELRGSFAHLTDPVFLESCITRGDYLRIVLTDENDIPDAIGRLRALYPNIMQLDYDNSRTRKSVEITGAENAETKSALELFAEFFELQNNCKMSDRQESYIRDIIEKIEEEML